MSIYVQLALTEADLAALRAAGADETVHIAHPDGLTTRDREAFAAAEIALGNCPAEWIAASTSLRWLQLASTGLDGYTRLAWRPEVICTNLPGAFADPVAQTCVAGMLMHYRGLDRLVALQRSALWHRAELRPRLRTMVGQRVLMLGAGVIAQRVVTLLAPFGCEVTTFARRSGDITTIDELDGALPDADIVCAVLPDTEQTRRLLDRRRLGLMKTNSLLVNAGRGSLIDETALIDALRAGHLAGAVLDVTVDEPLPPESPLWTCPNLLLTQHTAGGSNNENHTTIAVFAENLRRYRAGLPMHGIVDWQRGY
jgi:glyoxylate/hydroxypyruvate reductase A